MISCIGVKKKKVRYLFWIMAVIQYYQWVQRETIIFPWQQCMHIPSVTDNIQNIRLLWFIRNLCKVLLFVCVVVTAKIDLNVVLGLLTIINRFLFSIFVICDWQTNRYPLSAAQHVAFSGILCRCCFLVHESATPAGEGILICLSNQRTIPRWTFQTSLFLS